MKSTGLTIGNTPIDSGVFWSRAIARLWQMQSGAFLLGQFRPGSHPVLRPIGAAAPRRGPASSRCNYARSVLAGGEQPRFLARERGRADANLLFVRLPRTTGIYGSKGPAGSSLLRT